jgi:hypothetical protein
MLRLKGEDVHDGLREWIKVDLRESPRQGSELGKFFFSVSVGTVGALATIEKLGAAPRMGAQLVVAFVILFASMLMALVSALPRKMLIGGDSDLSFEYAKQIRLIIRESWIWFALWLGGTAIGIWAVRR